MDGGYSIPFQGGRDSPWLFPERCHNAHSGTVHYLWLDIRDKVGLEDVRLHGLRRAFASRPLALCETLSVIGKLLDHSDMETTARYAHLARETLREAAELIGDNIAVDARMSA